MFYIFLKDGKIHFNDAKTFVQGYPQGDEYNLRTVATHEIGISIFIT